MKSRKKPNLINEESVAEKVFHSKVFVTTVALVDVALLIYIFNKTISQIGRF